MIKTEPKFKDGDHVVARHSGKVYIVTQVWASDECGSFTCAVRGWRGGRYYGATRRMAESALMFESEMGPQI